jgi:hypothetical protein
MADEKTAGGMQPPISQLAGRPLNEFPTVPIVFADAALSHVSAGGITKFFLSRVDPNAYGRGGAIVNPALQIVMPTIGFLQMAAFFEQRIQALLKSGEVTQQQVDEARALAAKSPASQGE